MAKYGRCPHLREGYKKTECDIFSYTECPKAHSKERVTTTCWRVPVKKEE